MNQRWMLIALAGSRKRILEGKGANSVLLSSPELRIMASLDYGTSTKKKRESNNSLPQDEEEHTSKEDEQFDFLFGFYQE
ncbi:hypothetical protein PIB30_101075, partial [Stylosanthes scabra]|nr:hypothetical protein [Stylosanthes scabra]